MVKSDSPVVPVARFARLDVATSQEDAVDRKNLSRLENTDITDNDILKRVSVSDREILRMN